jgi:DNA-binding transcriptional MerR regulator
MSEPDSPQGKLYTLSEISNKTGISMPTLQRYKKLYQDRIPAEGRGRKQRYPENALPVFDQIRNENLGRRGRPRKDPNAPRPAAASSGSKRTATKGRASAAAAPAKTGGRAAAGRRGASKRAAAPAPAPAPARGRGRGPGRKAAASSGGTGKLMTLTQISEDTGISYPTLVRYVRLHGDRLPHEGKGRGRRFYPQAVDMFRELRSESGRGGRKPNAAKTVTPTGKRRGRPPGSGAGARAAAAAAAAPAESGLHKRLKAIEKSQENLEKKLRGFVKSVQSLFR